MALGPVNTIRNLLNLQAFCLAGLGAGDETRGLVHAKCRLHLVFFKPTASSHLQQSIPKPM